MKSKKQLRKLFVQQHGEYACGSACLSMIIKYYGGDMRQEDLRHISGTTLQGATLLGLYQASGKLGLTAKGYSADIESLKLLESPCILHVIKNQNIEHFIVFFGYHDDKYTIGDPALGGITDLSENEIIEIWKSKTLLDLKPNESFVQKKSEKKDKYEWMKHFLREDSSILIVSFALGIIIAALGLATAIFSQKLIDDLIPSRDHEKLILGILLFFLLLVFRCGLEYLRNSFLIRQTKNFNNRLVDIFFSKFLFLPKSFFDATKTGEIIARMNDSTRIQQTITFIVGDVLIDLLILVVAIIYLSIYSWKMALIVSICIPLFGLLVAVYNKRISTSQRNVMVSDAATEGLFIDLIQGVNEIKIANKQKIFKQSIKNMYGLFQNCTYKLGTLSIQYGFIAQIISTLTMISLIALGITWVLNGQLKLGELMAIITVGSMIISSTASLSIVNIRMQEAGVAFDRFYEFLRAKTEFESEESSVNVYKENNKNIHLQINQLSFRFIGRKKLFDNISLEVKNGEIITLFGEVGSGKSTLIQILQKHYLPESGEILFNGKLFSNYSTPMWREYIGVVNQHTKIFNGCVGENICLGNFEAERDRVIEFCKEYEFDSFFNNLPQGLYTLLGEDGINISGGQQQLISLARALYRRPSVLLLDEPTAAMDIKTEQFVMNILKRKGKEFAVILVTHRQRLAKYSDRIYILESGNLKESVIKIS